MEKKFTKIEDNSLLYYTFLSAIFYEFISNSKSVLEKAKANDADKMKDYFKNNNKNNQINYEQKIKLLLSPNKNAKKEIINEIKKIFKFESGTINILDNIQNNEESLFETIRKLIIVPIKSILSPDNNYGKLLNELLSFYLSDYIINSFSYYFYIIKLMKKNEDKKLGDLAVQYLQEEEEKEKKHSNQEKQLKDQLESLKIKFKKKEKENLEKCKELTLLNGKCEQLSEENEKKHFEISLLNEKYEQLSEENKKKSIEISRLSEENEKKNIEISIIKKKYQELNEKNGEIKNELQIQIDLLNSKFKEENEEKQKIKNKLEEIIDYNKRLICSNDDLNKNEKNNQDLFDSYSEKILELYRKNAELNMEVISLKMKLDKSESEKRNLYAMRSVKEFREKFEKNSK